LCSYRPPCDNPNDLIRFELENNLQLPSTDGGPNQLEPVRIGFVPSYFKIREEALYGFLKHNPVRSQLVRIEIILEIRRSEPAPIHHEWIVACQILASKKQLAQIVYDDSSRNDGMAHDKPKSRDATAHLTPLPLPPYLAPSSNSDNSTFTIHH
jgi:hypothetical protein